MQDPGGPEDALGTSSILPPALKAVPCDADDEKQLFDPRALAMYITQMSAKTTEPQGSVRNPATSMRELKGSPDCGVLGAFNAMHFCAKESSSCASQCAFAPTVFVQPAKHSKYRGSITIGFKTCNFKAAASTFGTKEVRELPEWVIRSENGRVVGQGTFGLRARDSTRTIAEEAGKSGEATLVYEGGYFYEMEIRHRSLDKTQNK